MKKTIKVEFREPRVRLSTEIVYSHRKYWGREIYKPLSLSLMWPQPHSGDKTDRLPLIVWLCGGGFTEMDRNIWLPELVWFAKHGYIIASVDYSTFYQTRFPEHVEDVKLAIRHLKAHAEEYNIDPERIAIMGESAGGYLTALCGVTGKNKEFDVGGHEHVSSEVQAAIPWYPPFRLSSLPKAPEKASAPPDRNDYADIEKYISGDTPPFLILHGTNDTLVPAAQGEMLYEALQKKGVDAELVLLDGAGHGDPLFVQDEVKQIILDFLDKKLK